METSPPSVSKRINKEDEPCTRLPLQGVRLATDVVTARDECGWTSSRLGRRPWCWLSTCRPARRDTSRQAYKCGHLTRQISDVTASVIETLRRVWRALLSCQHALWELRRRWPVATAIGCLAPGGLSARKVWTVVLWTAAQWSNESVDSCPVSKTVICITGREERHRN